MGPYCQCHHVALLVVPQTPLKNRKSNSQLTKSKRMDRNASVKGFVLLGGGAESSAKQRMVVAVIISAADQACACYDLDLTARITSQREGTSRQTRLSNPADRQEVGSWGYRPSQAPPAFGRYELYKRAPSYG